MREPSMKFPVTCPECAQESLGEFRIAFIATALMTGKSLRLYASCHDQYWTATAVEREQLREYLASITADAAPGLDEAGQSAEFSDDVAPCS